MDERSANFACVARCHCLQHAGHRGDLDIHADDAAAHDKLHDFVACDQQHADNAVRGEAVGDIEHKAASALAEERRKLLLRPALARRVELVGLVDQLECPRKTRVNRRGDLAERRPHRQGGKKILAAEPLALRLALDLLLHHLGARRDSTVIAATWVSGAHNRMRRHK